MNKVMNKIVKHIVFILEVIAGAFIGNILGCLFSYMVLLYLNK